MKKIKFRKYFIGGKWNIAIRKKNSNFSQHDFSIVNTSFSGWIADPFILEKDNKIYIFVERFNPFKEKGEIYCLEYSESNCIWKKIISDKFHMSYPNVYENDGDFYIIPETSENDSLLCYKATCFPYKWEYSHKISIGQFIDSTTFSLDSNLFFYTYKKNRDNFQLDFYEIDVDLTNPLLIKTIFFQEDICRPAGKPIVHQDYLLIPFQDGKNSYGEQIIFSKFTKSFDLIQTKLYVFNKDNIYVKNYKFDRIHTYNSTDNYEVIDFFIEKFDLFVIPRMMIRKIRKIYNKLFN